MARASRPKAHAPGWLAAQDGGHLASEENQPTRPAGERRTTNSRRGRAGLAWWWWCATAVSRDLEKQHRPGRAELRSYLVVVH
jgi:hypothetical protein